MMQRFPHVRYDRAEGNTCAYDRSRAPSSR
jgi:hypothetical protein